MTTKKYLTNKTLLAEIAKSKHQDKMTEDLGKMLTMIATKYSTKPNFRGYSYRDEMISNAILHLCDTWKNFDETKYDNPFAYYTQCIHNSFIQILNREKRIQEIRDEILLSAGLTPSFSYQE